MLLRRYINGKPITTPVEEDASAPVVGLLLRRYINGKPITTTQIGYLYQYQLDCYCEGT